MKITCISASNIEIARNHSASTRTCQLIADFIHEHQPVATVKVLPLIDYDLKPCRMCGECYPGGECKRDEAFNQLNEQLFAADALFLICPHYAPIPSKVMIMLEKLEEMAFLNWCADPKYRPPLAGKPVAIVAHGGRTDPEALPYYKAMLLDTLSGAFSSIGMNVIGAGAEWPNGVTFGIQNLSQVPGSIFVDIEHDWADIRQKVTPLVDALLSALNP